MKRLLLILLIALPVQAANEVRAVIDGSPTAYYVVREPDGDIFYPVTNVFEVFGTASRTMDDYDIALTDKSAGFYIGDFDTDISIGIYYITVHQQAGGSPANADPPVWVEYGGWDGTSVWTPGVTADVADAVWDEAVADHITETTFGGEVGGLDPNLTLVLADTDELQTDWADGGRLDVIQDAIKAMTDLIAIVDTIVSDANDANSFTITDGNDTNDAYFSHIIMVEDSDGGHSELRYITEWNATRVLLVDEPFSFTPAVGDKVWIMGTGYGGYLYDIWNKLWRLQSAIYYFSAPTGGSGATGGAGGTSYFDATGNDP